VNRTYSLTSDVTLFHADCRDAMKALPDNCLDSIVTDPPYGLQFMGKEWDKLWRDRSDADQEYVEANEGTLTSRARKLPDYSTMAKGAQMQETHLEWAREAFRVLKPGGHMAAFSASRTYHRMACAIEDAGFEMRDSLMWMYGTGFPKSHDVSKGIDKAAGAKRDVTRAGTVQRDGYGKTDGNARRWDNGPSDDRPRYDNPATSQAAQEWEGWGTALKPAFEPIVLARKPLSEGTVAANVLRWRTGALNIGACRVEGGKRSPGFTDSLGEVERSGSLMGTKTPRANVDESQGRWPANVVHDGSAEVVEAFPVTKGGGNISNRASPKTSGIYGAFKGEDERWSGYADQGSAARFFYSAKASKADRNESKHPTVKPIALMQWLARLITPPGGVVLDPFAGSGTTGAACALEGFRCVLVEREAEYVEDIRRRFESPSIAPK
jgi:DNA modification methylase